MDELALLEKNLVVGALLFGIGLIGFLSRRNAIVMFLAAEIMLQGVSLSLIAWSRFHNDWGGQMMVIFILTVAAGEAAIALAIVLSLFHKVGALDIAIWQNLREDNQPPFTDSRVAEPALSEPQWPKLTPAGIEPPVDPDEIPQRMHV